MENLYSSHNTHSVTHVDDNKALQKLKQMGLNLDLTKQKCQKAEARVKELENENRQLKGAEIRNGSLLEERDNLRRQVLTHAHTHQVLTHPHAKQKNNDKINK